MGCMFLKKWMFLGLCSSRKLRMALEVPSEPASTLGQNHSAGRSISVTAWRVSIVCSRASSYSVVTECCMTTR